MTPEQALSQCERWFDRKGWTVFDFQKRAWNAWHNGESGLIHSPTGSGKTLAAWLGPVQSALQSPSDNDRLGVLWITPLRALANDTQLSLQDACDSLDATISVDIRTGDTPGSRRSRQRTDPPFALVTTPESLSVMLSYPGSDIGLSCVHTVIVDEWHELLGSKRGVQLQLCLARLRKLCGTLRIWGVSATLANLDQAMHTLLGPDYVGTLIQGVVPRRIDVHSLLPENSERFKWSGHLGLQLLQPVIKAIDQYDSTLVFTNTRSQAEIWFQALLNERPDWIDTIALHHGSLDRKLRTDIEQRLSNADLNCVVCTSSLDLGVDFSPVDQVLQVGSPKGVARLLQRAGRSGHRPGAASRILCVPTNALELVEIAAVRQALAAKRIEARDPPKLSLDVLCQHLVTIAMGAGFVEQEMLQEVRSTDAFEHLNDADWAWVMDFITRGGQALKGYPQYHKVLNVAGTHRVMNAEVQKRHRMSIGTINSDTQMSVAFQGGRRLGTTEESFIARLNPGDTFQFAGRHLELVRIKDMTAYVRKAVRRSKVVPRWWGTQLPLTSELADSVQKCLHQWMNGKIIEPELDCLKSTLELQMRWSLLPGPDDFLIEYIQTHEGHSLFCYPFAGRLAHEGLAMVVALRLAAETPLTFTLQTNDYGFELQSPNHMSVDIKELKQAFSEENLLEDILGSINASEIAKRKFRDIARIAGLVFDGYPGQVKSARQVQASSSLIFDVLDNYDKDNLLLHQARREVLESQLEYQRLHDTLLNLKKRRWHICKPRRLTPLSFPLWAESLNSQTMSSQSIQQRIQDMLGSLETAALDECQT
ncbi:MAG: ligase-associated DNA damage response DEXH box helicase [Granulosicoccus sp.]|nr:ligase-associated DNA damage response DEXH box helicase [Granulosicoccus sp.]